MRVLAMVTALLLLAVTAEETKADDVLRARAVAEDMRGANNGNGPDVVPVSIEAGQADGKGEIVVKLPTRGDAAN